MSYSFRHLSDTDVILIKSMDTLVNVIGKESENFLNGAIMKFEAHNRFIAILLSMIGSFIHHDLNF